MLLLALLVLLPAAQKLVDVEQARAVPTASGAEPLYPLNHTFDADVQALGFPTNANYETAPYTVGTPPTNSNLETAPADTGTQPANGNFGTGTYSGWTTAGSPTIQSDVPHGYYASLPAWATVTSTAALTVASDAQAMTLDIFYNVASGYSWLRVYALTGPTFTTETLIGDFSCISCNYWSAEAVDLTGYQGQSVKFKFLAYVSNVAFDNVKIQSVFPGYTVQGKYKRLTEAGGNAYAYLKDSGAKLTTGAFTVDAASQNISVRMKKETASTTDYRIYVLSGPTFSTSTTVGVDYITTTTWSTIRVDAAAWLGQTIKLQVTAFANPLGVDDVALMNVEVPQWTVTAATRAETGGPTGSYVSTNGSLTSAAITLPANVQQLSVRQRADFAGSSFYLELLRGPTFATVTDLAGSVPSTLNTWKTTRVSVQAYAGETVKLRIRSAFNRMSFDDAGLIEQVVPGWTLNTTDPVQAGSDANGTYVMPGRTSTVYLKSAEINPAVLNATGGPEARYFSISYDIGTQVGALIRVTWFNTSGSGSWVTFIDSSNTPTGYRTRYFPVHDYMGAKGYFEVQIGDAAGKLYAIADNRARQQQQEPMSHKAGLGIDTSTGGFAFSDSDLRLAGAMPLSLSRFYAAHSDHFGTLGYRWTHNYDTRVAVQANGDAGVLYGSGGEEFFIRSAGTSTFTASDPRSHNTLTKNGDGTYTFKTSLNNAYRVDAMGNPTGINDLDGNPATLGFDSSGRLDTVQGQTQGSLVNYTYAFTATGRLTTITDLNSNVMALAYDGSGRLSTVTDPNARVLTLTYNASGRIATASAPASGTITYVYDANGDLTSVTDQNGGVRTYSYNKHRLTQMVDQRGKTVFTNVMDNVHRVVSQTDALGNAITFAYDTPAKGVTQITDALGGVAKYYFDTAHRTTDKVDPLSRVLSYVYDAAGNLQKVIDPANNQWQYAYDSSGGLVQMLDPLGNPVSITYNAIHLPTTVTDARGNTTTMVYDARGNLLTSTDPLGGVTTMTYDARGNPLTITNPLGQTESFTYDGAGNRTSRMDAAGKTWAYTYDSAGRQTSQTDPLGNTTTNNFFLNGKIAIQTNALGASRYYGYTADGRPLIAVDELDHRYEWFYDDRGRLVTQLDPAGKLTTYTYDGDDRMTSMSDPNDLTTTYAYNAADQITSITDPTGATTTYGYDLPGRMVSMTDALGRVSTYSYDASGRWLSTTLPNGGVYANTYDPNGNLLTESDPLGRMFTYMYDALNRRTRMTDPLLSQTIYTFDTAGRLTQAKDALNQITTHAYDARGLQVSTTDPLGAVMSFTYDNAGRHIGTMDPVGRTTTNGYDANNRLVLMTDPLGNATTYGYDVAGRRTSVTLPSGAATTSAYDARDLLTSVTNALGQVTSYGYDNGGRRVSMVDGRGFTTAYGYDGAGRQTSITDPTGGVVSFTFSAAGEMAALTNARTKTTSFTYNSLSLRLTETDPLGNVKTWAYDAAGQNTSYTDPRGLSQSYAHDGAGRLTGVAYPGGTVGRTYDALGRETSMTDSTGTTIRTYDAASRTTSVAAPAGTVQYSYNAAGDRTAMTLPGSRTVNYAYDGAGRLASLTDWASRVTSFGYNVNGWRNAVNHPNSVSAAYAYDGAGRTTSINHTGPSGALLSLAYTYDGNGNRVAATKNGGTENYTLDSLNRLTGVTYADGAGVSYTYDPNGNRTSRTTSAGTTAYTYDNADRLLSDGTSAYAYDAAGNLTARGADTFAYDYASRMTASTVSGSSASYAYDGADLRVSTTSGGVTTPSLWDRVCSRGTCGPTCGDDASAQVPLLIDDGTSAYLWADGLVGEVTGATRTDDLTDALGSVRVRSDGAGTIASSADYDVFGAIRASTGTQGSFRYTGEQWDATTGLEYLRARYYDPAVGRLISADTVRPNADGTQGYNPYAYVANNPTTWVDPTGHYAGPGAPPMPRAGGAMTDSTAAYTVAAGVVAGGTLAALGIAIRDRLFLLAAVLGGAWVLVEVYERVQDDEDRDDCSQASGDDSKRCAGSWGLGKAAWQIACCLAIVSNNLSNCIRGISARAPLPWQDPDGEICVEKIYPERG